MKKRIAIFYTIIKIIFICNIACSSQSEVEKLSGSDYFSAVHKALGEAQHSIFVVM